MEKRAVVLMPGRMDLAEQRRQDWVADVEAGTTPSDVLDAGYWSHMAAKMQPYDRIDARLETGEWVMELLVLSVGRNWATVHLIAKHELEPVGETPVALKHKVMWRGPHHKHCVVRLSDGEVIQPGFDKPHLAHEWLTNHEKVTAQV